eukprot:2971083-Heterocapsa_arctica.AAC.1
MASEGATEHPKDGESRKRSRSPAQEEGQEAVPMDVDQEGEGSQEPEEDHRTEQENLEFVDQHQYEDPLPGVGIMT